MLDVITIGGATRDIFFRIDDIKKLKTKEGELLTVPYGSKIVSTETFYAYGGGAINVAVSLSRLGLKSGSSCAVGTEGTGSMVLRYLEKEGVSTKYVVRTANSHTGLSTFVLGKDSEHTGFLERGANNYYRFKGFNSLRRPARWFYVSSLTGESSNELDKIFSYAKKKNIKIAFNPGSIQLRLGLSGLKSFLSQTEILILNKNEAQTLLGHAEAKPEGMLLKLAKYGPQTVVITDSGKGSWVFAEGKVYRQKAIHHGIMDTTGAGDAFGSTFLFGVIKGYAYPYCLKIAAINAASVISKMGAGAGLLSYKKIKGSTWL